MVERTAHKSEFNKRVFLLFLPLSVGIAAVFFAFYWYTSNILMNLVKDREKNIGLDISVTIGDLRYLLHQHELAKLIERNYKRQENKPYNSPSWYSSYCCSLFL